MPPREDVVYRDTLKELIDRLRRIEGQARGIQRMLEESRDCEEVLFQLAAMRSAINRVGIKLISNMMERCLREQYVEGRECKEDFDRVIDIFLKFS